MTPQPKFTVYYNGVTTAKGGHLLAVGWCNEGGWIVRLEGYNDDTRFRLGFDSDGDIHHPAVTTFEICIEASREVRSVTVKDDHGEHQVQMMGLNPVGSGQNTPGDWVESR
jgi:hypothetical protein